MKEEQRVRAVTDSLMGTKTFEIGDRVKLCGFERAGHADFAHLEGVPGTLLTLSGRIQTDWPVRRWGKRTWNENGILLESEVYHEDEYLSHYGDDYDDATLQEVRKRSTGA